MTPLTRKITLLAHITASIGWIGAVAAFEALAITGLTSQNPLTIRAAYLSMAPITSCIIVPFAFASLITGLILSLGTKWGLFRHYWVAIKFLINTISIALLLLHTRLINMVANAAAEKPLLTTDLRNIRIQLALMATAALAALLIAATLALFKPRGLTPYGARKSESS